MRRILMFLLAMPMCMLLLSCQYKTTAQEATVVPDNPSINEAIGKLFLARNRVRSGIYTFKSGLQVSIVKEGKGLKPGPNDLVTVYYQGRYINGRVFDSEHAQKNPITVPVSSLITGWQEAIEMMQPGSIWVLYIPPDLAYGEAGIPNKVGPNQTLIYYIHLLKVQHQ